MRKMFLVKLSFLVLCIGLNFSLAHAQTAFTYQGKLNDSGAAASGTYDFTFKLFSVAAGGTQIGADVFRDDVQVTNGVFTVQLDFGASPFTAMTGNFLEISVRPGAGTGAFTPLAPRLAVNNAPYSTKSLTADTALNATNAANATNATTATNALNLGGVAANQYVLTTDPRLSGANYINNTTTTQPSSNFNISGNGTLGGTLFADSVNVTTQYNIGGLRVLNANLTTGNLFAGIGVGGAITTGTNNALFGNYAGELTSGGIHNAFFGAVAGRFTVSGSSNAFVGYGAGLANTVGSNNTILGANANVGANNLNFATAIGAGSLVSSNNTLVLGRNLDTVQIPGNLNLSGTFNGGTLAANNLLVYPTSGNGNLTFRNRTNSNFSQTVFADDANVYRGYLGYIGANAGLGARNDTVEFGTNGRDLTFRPNETEVMRLKTSGRIGIGTSNPNFKLELIDSSNTGLRVQTNTTGGTVASFGGNGEFSVDSSGVAGGRFKIAENGNVGIGGTVFSSSFYKLTVSGTGITRSIVNSDSNAGFGLFLNNLPKWSVATVGSGQFQIFNDVTGSNAVLIDQTNNNVGIGTPTPTVRLDVNGGVNGIRVQTISGSGNVAEFGDLGNFLINSSGVSGGRLKIANDGEVKINNPPEVLLGDSTKLTVNGFIRAVIPPGIGAPVCWNFAAQQMLQQCGISSIRYKTNVQTFTPGLDLIRRLRPVSFDWKKEGTKDFGLIAEEVNEVEPLLNYYGANGEVEGVKYDRVSVVAVNAIKEQQTQIETQAKQIAEQTDLINRQNEKLERQQTEIERQKAELEALKKLVCSQNPAAEICQPQKQF